VAELHVAFVNLSALDWLLGRSLSAPPASLSHPDYAPYSPVDWQAEIAARREALIAASA
jgi:hypothetical protein